MPNFIIIHPNYGMKRYYGSDFFKGQDRNVDVILYNNIDSETFTVEKKRIYSECSSYNFPDDLCETIRKYYDGLSEK